MEQNKSNPQLYFKLKDMKVIYESFRQYLKGHISDSRGTCWESAGGYGGAVTVSSGTV